MTNPYAPPRAYVHDVADANARNVPADRGTRLGAAILDSLIFVVMVYAPFFIVAIMTGTAGDAMDEARRGVMIAAAGGFGLVGFVAWCWLTISYMNRNGQSIAKKLTGIKVVRSDGTPVSLGRLIGMRNVLNWVISMVPLYGLVDSLFIFGESRQCLHDKIADTIVVRA
jgi:uncharacterized RDD family membrane protein YckC